MDNGYDEDYISGLTDRVFLIKRHLEAGKCISLAILWMDLKESFDKIQVKA